MGQNVLALAFTSKSLALVLALNSLSLDLGLVLVTCGLDYKTAQRVDRKQVDRHALAPESTAFRPPVTVPRVRVQTPPRCDVTVPRVRVQTPL